MKTLGGQFCLEIKAIMFEIEVKCFGRVNHFHNVLKKCMNGEGKKFIRTVIQLNIDRYTHAFTTAWTLTYVILGHGQYLFTSE